VDGQANKALLKFLAKTLNLAPSNLEITLGTTSREKTITVSGLAQKELWERLDALLPGRGQE
jgi:uncharacterized protein YggU (UPF0235/DUF167 family)